MKQGTHIVAIGQVATRPKAKTFGENTVVTFTLAVNEKGGVSWLDITAWNNIGGMCLERFNIGDLVKLEGRLKARIYTTKKGERRKGMEIIISDAHKVERVKKNDSQITGLIKNESIINMTQEEFYKYYSEET